MEVILVEDKAGSEQGRAFVNQFPLLNIRYLAPDHGWGHMGFMRNHGLSKASGKYILFLDDDTVMLDDTFIEKLIALFEENDRLQGVMPYGRASYSVIAGRYAYHDPFFYTNRCMAYRRSCLIGMGGFDSSFLGQEDVEFAIRFIAKGYRAIKTKHLCYYHPPLIYRDSGKGEAVGLSFADSKYSLWVKLLLFLNGVRWLPLFVFQGVESKNKALFAYGFAKGFIYGFFKRSKKTGYS